MTSLVARFDPELSWKSWSAITIFSFGFIGFAVGVEVSERPEVVVAAQHDIFDLRNALLLDHIAEATTEFDHVIVPWGALHLPDIEAAILDDGFEPTERTRHRLLSWATVSSALAALENADAEPVAPEGGSTGRVDAYEVRSPAPRLERGREPLA